MTYELMFIREQLLQRFDVAPFCKSRIFDENLGTLSSRSESILWNKPTSVGACVLDIVKYQMFQFRYSVMKRYFSCTD